MKVTLFNLESIFHVILYLIIALAASHPPPLPPTPALFVSLTLYLLFTPAYLCRKKAQD